jgi:hypothetical protein
MLPGGAGSAPLCGIDRLAPAPGAAEDLAGLDLPEDDLLSILGFPDHFDAPRGQEIEIGGRQPFEEDQCSPLHVVGTETVGNLGEDGRRQGRKEPDGGEERRSLGLAPARILARHNARTSLPCTGTIIVGNTPSMAARRCGNGCTR